MYVQKKMMAKLEQERLADLANTHKQQQIHQQQIEALKTFASYGQINTAQHHHQQQQQQLNNALQKEQLTAILTAMMNNNNFNNFLNQQPQQLNTSLTNNLNSNNNKVNQSKNVNQASRKRSHSDLDACSSSEEEPFCFAKKLR